MQQNFGHTSSPVSSTVFFFLRSCRDSPQHDLSRRISIHLAIFTRVPLYYVHDLASGTLAPCPLLLVAISIIAYEQGVAVSLVWVC